MSAFQKKFTFEQRLHESQRIKERYPDRIPVIVEKDHKEKSLPDIKRHKFLCPSSTTVGQLQAIIRQRLPNISADKSIYVFVNNKIPSMSALLLNVYDEHMAKDGFLYVVYMGESVFG